jgi:2-polyprenyl-3-methyl-5-hydroxy-6-metoxy-1,4-benzoquinol methylase
VTAGAEPAPGQSSGLERANAWLEKGPENPWNAPSRLRGAGIFYRRGLRRLLRPYEIRQREFERAVVQALSEQAAMLGELARDRRRTEALEHDAHELRTRLGEVDAMLRHVQSTLDDTRTASAQSTARIDSVLERSERLEQTVTRADRELAHLQAHLHAAPGISERSPLRIRDEDGRRAIGFVAPREGAPRGYAGFEDIFRGPESVIRDRQRSYVPLLQGHAPVLDLGCGRGELLDLLAEAGVEARGVDREAAMVERCRSKGHAVAHDDGVAYLAAQPDESLGAVFSAQVIEHLDHDSLRRLLELALEKLVPGGLFVAETVNPHSIQALKNFWVDPTHVRPIFPEVAAALCLLQGFQSGHVIFPNGSGELERNMREEGDYAIVARKGEPAT